MNKFKLSLFALIAATVVGCGGAALEIPVAVIFRQLYGNGGKRVENGWKTDGKRGGKRVDNGCNSLLLISNSKFRFIRREKLWICSGCNEQKTKPLGYGPPIHFNELIFSAHHLSKLFS